MKRILISLMFSLLFSGAVLADLFDASNRVSGIEALPQLAPSSRVLTGQFTQLRRVAGMNAQLKSTGEFMLDMEQGFLWQQNTPFPTRLWINQQRMIQKMAQSQPVIITAQQNPLPFTISRIFFALFQGQFDGLTSQFELYLEQADGSWQLGLLPKDELMAKAIKQITVSGQQQISALEIIDRQGNQQQLQLTQLVQFAELTPALQERLQP